MNRAALVALVLATGIVHAQPAPNPAADAALTEGRRLYDVRGSGGRQGIAASPGSGNSSSSGGGGGSVGFFQTGTPVGVTPTIAPMASSPTFETNRSIPTR